MDKLKNSTERGKERIKEKMINQSWQKRFNAIVSEDKDPCVMNMFIYTFLALRLSSWNIEVKIA